MKVINGRVFDPELGFVARELYTDGTLIAAEGGGEVLDAAGCYVIPGLVDVHFHGCVGEDFSDATPEGLQRIADFELSQGVTYICPAGMTLPEEQLTAICKNVAAHRAKNIDKGWDSIFAPRKLHYLKLLTGIVGKLTLNRAHSLERCVVKDHYALIL